MKSSIKTFLQPIDKDSLAEIEFQLRWKSNEGEHVDSSLQMVNFWRDIIPQPVYDELMGALPGDKKSFRFPAGQLFSAYNPDERLRLRRNRFNETFAVPRYGRFYPKGALSGLAGVFPQNMQPVRCVDVEPDALEMDFNVPLAGRDLEVTAIVHQVYPKPYDRGGEIKDLVETVAAGAGMQVRCNGRPTDFFSPDAFARRDATRDDRFYQSLRLVSHIDARAIETVSDLYGRFIMPDMAVLDLMSSWQSHVPEAVRPKSLVGLGMNAEELQKNPQLTGHVIHDLNIDPKLPFDDDTFDAVICTVSVEYLIQPLAVFDDIARVLKPGGLLINTFSNRWFPPKAIKVWSELHDFERMGLVSEYFQASGKYTGLNTFSSRGWDRPETDKYYGEIPYSDPVYAVWGRKAG